MALSEPQRFFFLHLQKTAGTSLLFEFRLMFPGYSLYPRQTDGDSMSVGPQFTVARLDEAWAERRDQIRMVIGHFPLCTLERLDAPFTTLTMLREPVARTLSFLRHHRLLHPQDADRPLEDIYDDPFRYQALIHNHMTKMLGMSSAEMVDGMLTPLECDEGHLERAMQALDDIPVVGLQHRFADFCAEANRQYGWSLQGDQTINPSAFVAVDGAFEDRIRRDNALDMVLFEYACKLVESRQPTPQRRRWLRRRPSLTIGVDASAPWPSAPERPRG